MTFQANFAIFSSVIVLWKLAKPTGGGELSSLSLFYISGDFIMAVSKQFLTFTQQIDYLRNEKGITIANKQSAEDVLQRIGYFALMGGYKELFRIPFSKK